MLLMVIDREKGTIIMPTITLMIHIIDRMVVMETLLKEVFIQRVTSLYHNIILQQMGQVAGMVSFRNLAFLAPIRVEEQQRRIVWDSTVI